MKQYQITPDQQLLEKDPRNTQEIEIEKIEGTPFTLVRDHTKWFITMGNTKLTEPENTKELTLQKLTTEKWQIIMRVAIIITKQILKDEKNNNLD